MSLQARLEALASALGADIKADRITMTGLASGSLAALTTTAKSSLLAAINEINAKPAGADPWTQQAITGTQYSNSTTTASDVFTGFTPAAQQRHIVEAQLLVSSAAATTGVQIALAGPAGQLREGAVKIVSASAAATDFITHTTLNTFQAAAAGLTTPSLIFVWAMLNWGATAPASAVKLQAKSEVAGSAINIYPGSFLRWRTT